MLLVSFWSTAEPQGRRRWSSDAPRLQGRCATSVHRDENEIEGDRYYLDDLCNPSMSNYRGNDIGSPTMPVMGENALLPEM